MHVLDVRMCPALAAAVKMDELVQSGEQSKRPIWGKKLVRHIRGGCEFSMLRVQDLNEKFFF